MTVKLPTVYQIHASSRVRREFNSSLTYGTSWLLYTPPTQFFLIWFNLWTRLAYCFEFLVPTVKKITMTSKLCLLAQIPFPFPVLKFILDAIQTCFAISSAVSGSGSLLRSDWVFCSSKLEISCFSSLSSVSLFTLSPKSLFSEDFSPSSFSVRSVQKLMYVN